MEIDFSELFTVTGYGIIVLICTNKALYLFALSTALLLFAVNVMDKLFNCAVVDTHKHILQLLVVKLFSFVMLKHCTYLLGKLF